MVLLILDLAKGSHRILKKFNMHGRCCQCPAHIPLSAHWFYACWDSLIASTCISCLRAFSIMRTCLPFSTPREGYKCYGVNTLREAPNQGQMEIWWLITLVPLMKDKSGTHVLHYLPKVPSGIEPQLSTVVSCSLTDLCWLFPLSHFPILLVVFPGLTSQINYLHLTPRLSVCFWGKKGWDNLLGILGAIWLNHVMIKLSPREGGDLHRVTPGKVGPKPQMPPNLSLASIPSWTLATTYHWEYLQVLVELVKLVGEWSKKSRERVNACRKSLCP